MTNPLKSLIIHECAHYTACFMKDGSLIVQLRKTSKGVALKAPASYEWVKGIQTALDKSEASFLCKGILLNGGV